MTGWFNGIVWLKGIALLQEIGLPKEISGPLLPHWTLDSGVHLPEC